MHSQTGVLVTNLWRNISAKYLPNFAKKLPADDDNGRMSGNWSCKVDERCGARPAKVGHIEEHFCHFLKEVKE